MANRTFTMQLQRFAEKTTKKMNDFTNWLLLELGGELVMRSPVGNPDLWVVNKPPPGYVGGRFRANWQYSLNNINSATTEAVNDTPFGDNASAAKIIGGISSIPENSIGNVHYITNSLPYAVALEDGISGIAYKDGRKAHSSQAPNGVVGLTVLSFNPIVAKALGEISNG